VCSLLHLAHGLHQSVFHDNVDVRSGEALCSIAKRPKIFLCQVVRSVTQVNLEHLSTRCGVRECDVYSFIKAAAHRRVKLPRHIGCSKNEDARLLVVAHALLTAPTSHEKVGLLRDKQPKANPNPAPKLGGILAGGGKGERQGSTVRESCLHMLDLDYNKQC
jgi:hypothetical protein